MVFRTALPVDQPTKSIPYSNTGRKMTEFVITTVGFSTVLTGRVFRRVIIITTNATPNTMHLTEQTSIKYFFFKQ